MIKDPGGGGGLGGSAVAVAGGSSSSEGGSGPTVVVDMVTMGSGSEGRSRRSEEGDELWVCGGDLGCWGGSGVG